MERRRKRAMGWHLKGWSQYRIAKKLGVSFEAVSNWVGQYKSGGLEGLATLGRPGPKSSLTDDDRKKVRSAILRGPQAYGYDTGIWTLERMAAIIRKLTKATFKTTHTWRIVTMLGFSCQKPDRRAKERDEKAIKNWRQRTFSPAPVMGEKT